MEREHDEFEERYEEITGGLLYLVGLIELINDEVKSILIDVSKEARNVEDIDDACRALNGLRCKFSTTVDSIIEVRNGQGTNTEGGAEI